MDFCKTETGRSGQPDLHSEFLACLVYTVSSRPAWSTQWVPGQPRPWNPRINNKPKEKFHTWQKQLGGPRPAEGPLGPSFSFNQSRTATWEMLYFLVVTSWIPSLAKLLFTSSDSWVACAYLSEYFVIWFTKAPYLGTNLMPVGYAANQCFHSVFCNFNITSEFGFLLEYTET